MRQFDEYILECSAALSELAHSPVAINGQPENLFAHVRTGFDSQREFFPIVLAVRDHVSNARNLLQFLDAVIVSDFCFELDAAGLSDFPE